MPLDSTDLVALSRLLDQALDLDPGQLSAWLDDLPAEHQHLAPRLVDIMREHSQGAAADFLSSGPRLNDVSVGTADAKAGASIGPYRLIREIGRGGMGLVWLAERSDGGLKRPVALKLPRLVWGAGLGERMARERDIGARLEHPHIARLYDAGIDALGRPYLAFEYIDGQAIDAWCKAHALTVPQRLKLFVQVARAVAYAHGQLVVHRDLKPSNVLVSADGQAHLLDFGIAKLIDEVADDASGLTQEQGRVLTPHYASPEQLRGDAITVASDVYSLGVLLYELLVGRLPFDRAKGLAAREQGTLEVEAPPASRAAVEVVAAAALRGDVDAILAKAMRSDPADRYATADALAEDIERHLDGERVLAQPDRAWYRLSKALRRHRLSFALAGTALFAVLAGAAVSIVQAQRAREAADRAGAVKEFVLDVFRVNERGNPANEALRQLPAEVLLERGASRIATRFAGDTRLQAELYGVVAGVFADMTNHERAEEYARKQLAALEALGARRDERAHAMTAISTALIGRNRPIDAERAARQAIALADGAPDEQTAARLALVDALMPQSRDAEVTAELDHLEADLGARGRESSIQWVDVQAKRAFLLSFSNFDRAAALYGQAIAKALEIQGALSPLAIQSRLVLARGYVNHDQLEPARLHTAAALTAMRARGGVDEISAAVVEIQMTVHMALHETKGRTLIPMRDALATVERLMAELKAAQPLVPRQVLARAALNLGVLNQNWGNMMRAHELIPPAVEIMRATWVDNPWMGQLAASTLGIAEMYVGHHARADPLLRESIEWGRRAGRGSTRALFIHVARNLMMQRRFDVAEAELAGMVRALKGADAGLLPGLDEIHVALAEVELERGDAQAALELLPPDGPNDDDYIYWDRRLVRGAALCALGRAREGLSMIDERLAVAAENHYPHDPQLARWRAKAGFCAVGAGDRRRALELLEQARRAFIEQPGVSPFFSAPLAVLASRLGRTPGSR